MKARAQLLRDVWGIRPSSGQGGAAQQSFLLRGRDLAIWNLPAEPGVREGTAGSGAARPVLLWVGGWPQGLIESWDTERSMTLAMGRWGSVLTAKRY